MDLDTAKAPKCVNAWIRRMHRKQGAYTNPTCALRAPFLSHTFRFCFDLCRAREVNAQTPTKTTVTL